LWFSALPETVLLGHVSPLLLKNATDVSPLFTMTFIFTCLTAGINCILLALLNTMPAGIVAPPAHGPEELMPSVVSP